MAQDRNGKPVAKDNLVRVPNLPVRTIQTLPNPDAPDAELVVLYVYPDGLADDSGSVEQSIEYVTGRVLEVVDDAVAIVQVQGVERPVRYDTRLVEVTA